MMIEKKHNINPITFSWIFTIIFSLYFLSNDTNFGLTPWWTLLVICFFIVAVFSKKGILQLRITSEKICYLIMFIVILGNFFRTDSRHDSSTEAYIISFTIFVIYMLFCESEKKTLLNQTELAGLYTTADVFVNPTYEDNYPTVNLEAEACGTPVISYDTGGSRETLKLQQSKIVKVGDVKAIVKFFI